MQLKSLFLQSFCIDKTHFDVIYKGVNSICKNDLTFQMFHSLCLSQLRNRGNLPPLWYAYLSFKTSKATSALFRSWVFFHLPNWKRISSVWFLTSLKYGYNTLTLIRHLTIHSIIVLFTNWFNIFVFSFSKLYYDDGFGDGKNQNKSSNIKWSKPVIQGKV